MRRIIMGITMTLWVFFALSCSLFFPLEDVPFTYDARSGSMLIQHGSWIYQVGGMSSERAITSSVYVQHWDAIDEPWEPTVELPATVSHGTALVHGSTIYVLGGSNGTEDVDTIYYAVIDASTGHIKSAPGWQLNRIRLPIPISGAVGLLHEGRIYLVGGKSGNEVLDTIYHARIYQDGQVGQWYKAPQKLPSARHSASGYVVGDTFYIIGGSSIDGDLLSDITTFSVSGDGTLSTPQEVAQLPEPLALPCVAYGEDFLLIGGGLAAAGNNDDTYSFDLSDSTVTKDTELKLEGLGSTILSDGRNIILTGAQATDEQVMYRATQWSAAPRIPSMSPASGIIKGSAVDLQLLPDYRTEIRYRVLDSADDIPETLSEDDTTYTDLLVSPGQRIAFQSIAENGKVSPVALRHYLGSEVGSFPTLSARLVVQEDETPMNPIVMEEVRYGGDRIPVQTLFLQVDIAQADAYHPLQLLWEDYSIDGTWTEQAKVTLYERDFLTVVRDASGVPLAGRTSDESPISLALQAGTYRLQITSLKDPVTDGEASRTLGMVLCR
jgi:hypothetical protein